MRVCPLLRLGWFFLVAASAAVCASAAETVAYGPPPDWVDRVDVVPASTVREHSSGVAYELVDSQVHVEREESYVRNVARILAENGLSSCGELRFTFDPDYQTLTIHHVRILRQGTALNRLDPAKVKVLRRERGAEGGLYDGRLTALVIVDDVRVGDVVDYAFTIRGRNPVFGGVFADSWWLQGYSPWAWSRVRLVAPEGRPLWWHIFWGGPVEPAETRAGGFVDYRWERRDVPGIEYERGTPGWFRAIPVLQVSAYPDWDAVIAWGRSLYPLDSPLPNPLLEFADSLRGLPPARRATEALHKIQAEVRYLSLSLGESSHRPHLPMDVFEHRFGDCKDKALLLACLFRNLGLDAAPALVDAGAGRDLDERLPSPLVFDHAIVHLRLDGRDYWLDPTDSYQAGDLDDHAVPAHGWALPLRADTHALIKVIPPEGGRRWLLREETYTSRGLDQPAELSVRTAYRGLYAENMRAHLAGINPERFATERINGYLSSLPSIKATAAPQWTDSKERNEVVVEETYTIPGFWEFNAAKRTHAAQFTPYLLYDYIEKIDSPKRRMPLACIHPAEIEDIIVVRLHDDWKITPINRTDTTEAFTLTTQARYADRRFTADYHFRSTNDHIDADRVPDYARAVTAIRDVLGYRLTHTLPAPAQQPAATPADPKPAFSLNWPVAMIVAFSFAGALLAAWLIFRLKPDGGQPPRLPAHPELAGLGGWLILVAIGLCVSLVRALVYYHSHVSPWLNLYTWNACTTPGAARYNARL